MYKIRNLNNKRKRENKSRLMGRRLSLIFILIFLYILVRILFCYTIVSLPYMLGQNTFVSKSKTDFPICVMNPIKSKEVKKWIVNDYYNVDLIRSIDQEIDSFNFLNNESTFNVISYENSSNLDGYNNSKENLYFLLQSKRNKSKKCVVCIDKDTHKVLFLYN